MFVGRVSPKEKLFHSITCYFAEEIKSAWNRPEHLTFRTHIKNSYIDRDAICYWNFYKLLSDFVYSSVYKWLICLKITNILQPCSGYEVVSLILLLECTSLCLRFYSENEVSHCYDKILARNGYFADVFALKSFESSTKCKQIARGNEDFVMVPRIREREPSRCCLRNHVSVSSFLSLLLSSPLPRGTLPAPAHCFEKEHLPETVWGHVTKSLRKQKTKHGILRKPNRKYT
jgi:hypothetical protein